MKNLFLLSILALFLSCSSTAKFPISDVILAAEIIAKKKKDSNNNYLLTVTAKYLAEAERLSPSRNNYSVWGITKDKEIKNLGRLTSKKGNKAFLKTSTPFDVKEILITAEKEGDRLEPRGLEISRVKF